MTPAVSPSPFRRFAAGLVACAAFGALAQSQAAAAAPGSAAPVRGLIVQLRDAPSHGALARERHGQPPGVGADALPLAAREAGRWRSVLDAAPQMRLAGRRAAGASAQVLQFERPLARAEAQALIDRLAARADVAWVVPNVRERRLQAALAPPNDLYYQSGQQWWPRPVAGSDGVPISQRLRGVPGFLTAWTQVTTGSAAATVAVLDTGGTAHPELNARVLAGIDLVSDPAFSNDGDARDNDPSDPGDWVDDADKARDPANFDSCDNADSSWHGTAIAGIVAARTNNAAGMAGINWQASVLPVRVAAKCGADLSDIVDGMRWVAGLEVCMQFATDGSCLSVSPAQPAARARIVNISFGGDGDCTVYQPVIDALRSRGVVVVAAAGNEFTTPTRPAKCPGVVGVVATNRDGFKSNYSNFGPELAASGLATVGGDDDDGAWGDLLADPGLVSIGNTGTTTAQTHAYFYYYGTSFSAPVVAGAVSLMLSVNPALSVDQIIDGLKRSARPHVTSTIAGVDTCSQTNPGRCLCTTETCGAGLLDVSQALAYAGNPGAYVAPARTAEVINASELATAAARGPDRPPNGSTPPPSSGGGGGGGAASAVWLLALAVATAALGRRRPR